MVASPCTCCHCCHCCNCCHGEAVTTYVPGPGAYNIPDPWSSVACSKWIPPTNFRRPSSPGWGFGSAPRYPSDERASPGPGTYNGASLWPKDHSVSCSCDCDHGRKGISVPSWTFSSSSRGLRQHSSTNRFIPSSYEGVSDWWENGYDPRRSQSMCKKNTRSPAWSFGSADRGLAASHYYSSPGPWSDNFSMNNNSRPASPSWRFSSACRGPRRKSGPAIPAPPGTYGCGEEALTARGRGTSAARGFGTAGNSWKSYLATPGPGSYLGTPDWSAEDSNGHCRGRSSSPSWKFGSARRGPPKGSGCCRCYQKSGCGRTSKSTSRHW